MSLLCERRCYRLTGITPILGSQPSNPAVRTQWIASRAPDPALSADEVAMLGDEDAGHNGPNVFLRDVEGGDALFVYDYTLRGFFKGALAANQAQLKIAMPRTKIDRYVFCGPRMLYLLRDGRPIIDEDDYCERSLRASGPKGERTALAASEMVLDPWQLEFEVKLYPNRGTAKSDMVTWETIEAALDYGEDCGLGQWRTGGMGRFTWERIEALSPCAGRKSGGWAACGALV